MKKTIISHFYNEEYLLPHWLNHHKKYFDHGILINYNSTDKSCDIIKEICPNWEVIDSRNVDFESFKIDDEVSDVEKPVDGWRVVLNTTEFLIGDFELLDSVSEKTELFIPQCVMIDEPSKEYTGITGDILLDRDFGLSPFDGNNFRIRRSRRLSNYFSNYPIGRHFEQINTDKFIILWYGYSPFNEETINRKLQIKNRIPQSDVNKKFGVEHMVNRDELVSNFLNYQKQGKSLKELINNYYG